MFEETLVEIDSMLMRITDIRRVDNNDTSSVAATGTYRMAYEVDRGGLTKTRYDVSVNDNGFFLKVSYGPKKILLEEVFGSFRELRYALEDYTGLRLVG